MTWWDGGIDLSPHAGAAPTPNTGVYLNNSADALYTAYTAAWSTWIPTLGNVTPGNGTEVRRYFSIGGRIHFLWVLTLGTTSAIGSLPTIEFTDYDNYGHLETGIAGCYDSSTGLWYPVAAHGTSSNTLQIETNATYPFTWATSDVLSAQWTWRKAPPDTTIGV